MAKLGTPVTNDFMVGTAELRLGPLNMANKLTQAHSVGLIDTVTMEVSQESVELKAGFPKALIDTAVSEQVSSLTATLREYSRRNLGVLLGEGILASATAVETTVPGTASAGDTSLTVTSAASISASDVVVVYPKARPEEISVCRVDSIATDTLTFDAGTPLLHNVDGGADEVNVYVSHATPIGAVSETNYFSAQVVTLDRSKGKPIGFNFWKAAVSSGMNLQLGSDDFASTDLSISFLEPTISEYSAGQPLEHLAQIIPMYPTGMVFKGA